MVRATQQKLQHMIDLSSQEDDNNHNHADAEEDIQQPTPAPTYDQTTMSPTTAEHIVAQQPTISEGTEVELSLSGMIITPVCD